MMNEFLRVTQPTMAELDPHPPSVCQLRALSQYHAAWAAFSAAPKLYFSVYKSHSHPCSHIIYATTPEATIITFLLIKKYLSTHLAALGLHGTGVFVASCRLFLFSAGTVSLWHSGSGVQAQ